VLLTDLARRLADDASRIPGLGFSADEHAHRTALVDVVQWLDGAGALRLRDGSTNADLEVDALYDVDHEIVHALCPSLGLRDLDSIEDRFRDRTGDSRDERRRRTRNRVTRLVLERPCVLLADLDDEERAWLQRNVSRLAGDLLRLTGLTLERRREGVALIDTERDASDRAFPAPGSPAQLALLVADALSTIGTAPAHIALPTVGTAHARLSALIDGARQGEQLAEPIDDASGDLVPAWPFEWIERLVIDLIRAHPGVRRELREDPAQATRVVTEELVAMDLARVGDIDGVALLVPTPPLARYRAFVPTRSEPLDDQLGLFGELE
jgi:uncharacterized protein (TIGR02678 family)